MDNPDQIKNDLVKQWLDLAESDLGLSKHLLDEGIYLEDACFHCQQAAEKYLKAFLVRHQIEFPKTHNLGELLERCAKADPGLASALKEITASSIPIAWMSGIRVINLR
jgi:HEPN domain-containing protein